MNMFRLISRSLVITTVVLSSVQVKGMTDPKHNFHIEAEVSVGNRVTMMGFRSKDILNVAVGIAGCPQWAVSMVAAAGDALERSYRVDNWEKINKKAFAVNIALYAGLDAAKRYAVDAAGSYVGLPSFMTEKFAGFSSSVQAAFKYFGSFFGQMLHDHTTRMGVSAINSWYFTPKKNVELSL